MLVSAEPGYEFIDWGGQAHMGGGSHGSLHRCDSLGVLLTCGFDMPEREQWSIEDATPLVLDQWAGGVNRPVEAPPARSARRFTPA